MGNAFYQHMQKLGNGVKEKFGDKQINVRLMLWVRPNLVLIFGTFSNKNTVFF